VGSYKWQSSGKIGRDVVAARKDGTIAKTKSKPRSRGTVAERAHYEYRANNEDFVVVDKNVATHLVRNALGGGDTEKLCGRAGAQPPLSRTARDDITVQIIFFDDI
jgi:pyruvate dehydrogenase phosphatase